MHQDMWSERFEGNGAPDWATIDDGSSSRLAGGFPSTTRARHRPVVHELLGEPRRHPRRLRRAFARLAGAAREAGVLGYDAFNEPSCEIQLVALRAPARPAAGAQWLAPFYDEVIPALARRPDATRASTRTA